MAHLLKLCQFSTPAALNGINLVTSEKWNLLLLLSLELIVFTSALHSERVV